MKKLLIVFLVSLFFVPESLMAQSNVANRTDYNIIVSKDRLSRNIAPGGIERIPFFPAEGEVHFQITWREHGSARRESVAEIVSDGKISITNKYLQGKKRSLPKSTKDHYLPEPEVIQSAYKTELVIKNESSRTLWIREGRLEGLVLNPGQASDTILVSLGMLELTMLADLDEHGNSTGRNYMQKVVTGLIAKDQKSFAITETHLNIPSTSETATFIFYNQTGFDVVGVGSIALGKVIEANSRMRQRRVEANEGFINTAWQYLDHNGVKRQAISEFIVLEGRIKVFIMESDLQRVFIE